jgi:hypothetical protein
MSEAARNSQPPKLGIKRLLLGSLFVGMLSVVSDNIVTFQLSFKMFNVWEPLKKI